MVSGITRVAAHEEPLLRANTRFTTNPIESTFATVRLRTARTKGCGSRVACLAMVFKLAQSAEQHWRALNGSSLLEDVIRGIQFVDGLRKDAA